MSYMYVCHFLFLVTCMLTKKLQLSGHTALPVKYMMSKLYIWLNNFVNLKHVPLV